MTREDTKKLLLMISATFPNFNVVDKTATVQIWSALLEAFEFDLISKAFVNYAKTNTSGFAPTPAQLIECAYDLCETTEVSEGKAWNMLMQAIKRSGDGYIEEFEKLPDALKEYVGNAWQLRIWALSSEFNESVERSLFVKRYATICQKAKQKFILNGMQNTAAIAEDKSKYITEVKGV